MKVALYARVSSEAQDVSLSISAQLKALREFAERNDDVVVREFIDEAETGRSVSKRPAFREMVTLAEAHENHLISFLSGSIPVLPATARTLLSIRPCFESRV